jgi:hypothetical protein
MFTTETLHKLATIDPGQPVASIYARTDPRQSDNTTHSPAWEIELRNGLRSISDRLSAGDDRESDQAFRALHERIETEIVDLDPTERGRSYVWFLQADGETIDRFALQLPVREPVVIWDSKPYISPLVDVADRGSAVGIVLVGRESVRLMDIEQGEAAEPANSVFELELGDWRPYGGSAGGSSARGAQTTSHEERFETRVDEHRDKLYSQAAAATAKRLEQLGWQRIVIASEGQVHAQFIDALPPILAQRVIATPDLNLAHMEPHEVAEVLEPLIEEAWERSASKLAGEIHDHALAGGPGSLGVDETLAALGEGRVEHLVLDPEIDFAAALTTVPDAIGGPAELLGERAVEKALATSAQVTTHPVNSSDALRESGGMMALLRY